MADRVSNWLDGMTVVGVICVVGASSTIICTFVPLMPKELMPAKRRPAAQGVAVVGGVVGGGGK